MQLYPPKSYLAGTIPPHHFICMGEKANDPVIIQELDNRNNTGVPELMGKVEA